MGNLVQKAIDSSKSLVGLDDPDVTAPAPTARAERVQSRVSAAGSLRRKKKKGLAASLAAGSEGTKETLG